MMHAKKVVLDEGGGGLEAEQPLPESPAPSSSYTRMDKEMRDILLNEKLSEFDKCVLYQQVLGRYLRKLDTHKKAKHSRRKDNEFSEALEQNASETKYKDSTALEALKELTVGSAAIKARLLYGILEKAACLEWDSAGRVTIMGTPTGASVKDYVEASMKRRPPTTPLGWNLYVTALKSLKIPPSYVNNYQLQEALNNTPVAAPTQFNAGSSTAEAPDRHERSGRAQRWTPY
jgi:hypothetical protein